jgi:hypothetical protein
VVVVKDDDDDIKERLTLTMKQKLTALMMISD